MSNIGLYVSIFAVGFVIVDGFRLGSDVGGYGEYKLMFKKNWLCRSYVPISYIYRIILSILIAYNLDNIYSTLYPIFLSLTFILIMLINTPFTSALHNYRCIIIHTTQLITLVVANYYRTMKSNMPLKNKSHIHTPAIILYVSVAVAVGVSLVVLAWEIWRKIKKIVSWWRRNRVENLEKDQGKERSIEAEE
jgi:hypothetical protein